MLYYKHYYGPRFLQLCTCLGLQAIIPLWLWPPPRKHRNEVSIKIEDKERVECAMLDSAKATNEYCNLWLWAWGTITGCRVTCALMNIITNSTLPGPSGITSIIAAPGQHIILVALYLERIKRLRCQTASLSAVSQAQHFTSLTAGLSLSRYRGFLPCIVYMMIFNTIVCRGDVWLFVCVLEYFLQCIWSQATFSSSVGWILASDFLTAVISVSTVAICVDPQFIAGWASVAAKMGHFYSLRDRRESW